MRNGLSVRQNKNGQGSQISRIETIAHGVIDPNRVGYAELTEFQKDKFHLVEGDILFSHINSVPHVGKTAIVETDHDIYHGMNLLLLRTVPEIHNQYFEYFLQNLFQSGYWRSVCKQSVNQASVNQQDVGKVRIAFPTSTQEQQRIVAILDEAFDGIASAVAATEQNLVNARELFESQLSAIFSSSQSGWNVSTIGEICTLKSGTTVNKNLEIPEGDIPYVKVADMSHRGNETQIVGSSRFLDSDDVRETTIFPIGTTIFPKRGGAIATNKKRITAVPICTDLNIMGVIPPKSLIPELLYFYFLSVDMKDLGSGTSIPQINNYDIGPLIISYPEDMDGQAEIVRHLSDLQVSAGRLEGIYQHKFDSLSELKQSILQKAFTGELTAEPDKALAAAGL